MKLSNTMQASFSLILFFAVLSGILGAMILTFRMRPARQSRIGLASAVFPSLLMLLLFYSLAIHMRLRLGAWPMSIGDRDFPASLVTHDSLAANYFTIFMLGLFGWPVAFLLCFLVKRWRGLVYYLGVYA